MFKGYVSRKGVIVITVDRQIYVEGCIVAQPKDILLIDGRVVRNLSRQVVFSLQLADFAIPAKPKQAA